MLANWLIAYPRFYASDPTQFHREPIDGCFRNFSYSDHRHPRKMPDSNEGDFGIDGGNRFRCAEESSTAAIGFMCVGGGDVCRVDTTGRTVRLESVNP